jgi:hypothetical protein
VPQRQKVLVLYLTDSSLDSTVIAWAEYDGTGTAEHMAGDSDRPPYPTGLAALQDGWRLLQMAPLSAHAPGAEFTTAYLKYEFVFEQLVDIDG